ncbi:MAG: glycoside hydrolase family 31 protein [Chitinophagales bacterium]
MPVTRNESLGSFVSFQHIENGLEITATNGLAAISIYHRNIIRIKVSKVVERDFSYAVNAKADGCEWKFTDANHEMSIQTESLELRIQKSPLRFSFLNKAGQVLCEDDSAFGTSWMGTEVTTYKKLQPNERFIGLGEKTGNLDRRGTAYTNWNTDKFAYATDQDPLYMSIPFYIGIHSGLQYGIFLDNTYKTHFNFGASNDRFSFFGAADGAMNYYFIGGENVAAIISNYTRLTGKIELPPIWSLGLQQCRYSYYPDTEVIQVARTFREKRIPCDMIYLDIHYMDGYKVFTFDKERFPVPANMVAQLQQSGFHTAVILDPGIKTEPGYQPYDEGLRADNFVKYPDGQPFEGEVWPGKSHFPDFTREEVRQWWAGQMQFYTSKGINAFWNDMNEPAMWGQSPPDIIEFDYDGETSTHKRARNVYGMQMARSTYEGAKKQMNGKRPFLLNRAGFSGVQRYSASWTGDNVASDENLICGVRLVNSLGLSGVAFAGYDVGGFCGDATPSLFAKWIVLGAFSPLFRCHSMINSKDAEPWSFGEEVEEISRNYISLRYRLLPYIYSLFYEAANTGMPVVRSLAVDFPHESRVYDPKYQNQYLFGGNILVPVFEGAPELTKVYLPKGYWYDIHNDQYINGGIQIAEVRKERYPLFVKASAILPMQQCIQHTGENTNGVLELHIYFGNTPSEFMYYEDDGLTYNYGKGEFYQRTIRFEPEAARILFSAVEGQFTSKFETVKLMLHGFEKLESIEISEKKMKVASTDYCFIAPVSNFDPFYKAATGDMICKNVQTVEFPFSRAVLSIQLPRL